MEHGRICASQKQQAKRKRSPEDHSYWWVQENRKFGTKQQKETVSNWPTRDQKDGKKEGPQRQKDERGGLTEMQRRIAAAEDPNQETAPCIVCGTQWGHWYIGYDLKKQKKTPIRDQCYVCTEPLCPKCKEPKHVNKTDCVYRWCPKCYTGVGKCQRCREPLSKYGNNLMWCRTPTVSNTMCHHLICKPCGEKHGGCTWHNAEPLEGELAQWAGYTIDKENWKAEKIKWRNAQPYYAREQAKKKERDQKQQESEQDARDEDKDMQQVVTK